MKFEKFYYKDACVQVAHTVKRSETGDHYAAIHIANRRLYFLDQAFAVMGALAELKHRLGDPEIVFVRLYLSDPANQIHELEPFIKALEPTPVSLIGQGPLDGTRIAAQVRLMSGAKLEKLPSGLTLARHNTYLHMWGANRTAAGSTVEEQTRSILRTYSNAVVDKHFDMYLNTLRTWFYIRDIDHNYQKVNQARSEVYKDLHIPLTCGSIASTGIGARLPNPENFVSFDAYTVGGVLPGQYKHLNAPTHMPTPSEYGANFERGTVVDYIDRQHIIISGTASIDTDGTIAHPQNAYQQTLRLWNNIEALLRTDGKTFQDIGQMTVYVRDQSDFPRLSRAYEKFFPNIPTVLVRAEVCRQGWLTEMECEGTYMKK